MKTRNRTKRAQLEQKKDGLYIREAGAGYRRVCARIRVKAVARVDGTNRHLAIIKYQDQGGNRHKEIVPLSMLQKSGLLKDRLLDGGFPFPSGDDGDVLLAYLRDTSKVRKITIVLKTGWIGRGAYAFPDGTVGPNRKEYLYQSPHGEAIEAASGIRGSLKYWQSTVAIPAEKSAVAIFAIAVAFASMIMRWHKTESGGFHLFAQSSKGKTTILMAAQSVIYPVAVEGLVHWDATVAGLEQEALRCNDGLLILDEMGHLAGEDEKLAATQAAKVSYRLAGGKGRLRSALYDPAGHMHQWNLLFLSSGEMSLAGLHRDAARKRYGGDELRLIDVPAALSEVNGIFDQLADQDESAELVRSIRIGSTENYGHAARQFLTSYMSEFDRADEKVNKWIAAFYRHVEVQPGGPTGRLAHRFALAYAAARLARFYGVVPWSKERILQAISLCYSGALNTIPDRAALLSKTIESVRKKLQKSRHVLDMREGRRYDEEEMDAAGAYLRGDSDEGDFYAVKPEALAGWLESGVTLHALGQELLARNALLVQARNLPTKQVKIKGVDKKASYYCVRKSFVIDG
ncbi:DUF927 domain-containing protein [Ferrovibrio sp.]|uniref:DUF927 domain-containing protein n=1 Tax=Ferrovibrio sp. TaxID=1917215 RepID=UPI0035AFCFA6